MQQSKFFVLMYAKALIETSPHILVVYMNPEDPEDFEKWYREEHLALLARLPGYHRSLRYKLGPKTPLTQGETQPYLAIHFVSVPRGLSPFAIAANKHDHN